MTLFDLLRELETMETNCDLQMEIGGIKNDSRKVRQGDLFVAISGAADDGHIYIPKAIELGAVVVVSEKPLGNRWPYVVVPDSKVALSKLASAFFSHPSRKMHMVGVTGTNGKTTTTHILQAIFRHEGKVGLIGTNHIMIGDEEYHTERTTPDAVALHGTFDQMVKKGTKYCVMEVSSHALDQCRVDGIQYQTAVFTNLTQDHLDYHRDMEDYFNAKRKLFGMCDNAVINADDPCGARLIDECVCPVITYSQEDGAADLTARSIKLLPNGVEFEVRYGTQRESVFWGTPGKFSVSNALAAIGAALMAGLGLEEIADRIRTARPVMGRMEIVPVPAPFTVVIDYAHTPDALENVLEAAREVVRGRLLLVFGCGGDRDAAKRPLMGRIAARMADVCIVTSDNPRTEDPSRIIDDIVAGMGAHDNYRTCVNRVEAIDCALSMAAPGDMVLLCGKGHETYQEIFGQKYPMDERQIVEAHWRESGE